MEVIAIFLAIVIGGSALALILFGFFGFAWAVTKALWKTLFG